MHLAQTSGFAQSLFGDAFITSNSFLMNVGHLDIFGSVALCRFLGHPCLLSFYVPFFITYDTPCTRSCAGSLDRKDLYLLPTTQRVTQTYMADPQKPVSDGGDMPDHNWCGTSQLDKHLLASVPGYKASRQFVASFSRLVWTAPWPVDGVGIPVVVHVVWNTEQQKISQAQIDSQIATLNQDFLASNTDLSTVPAVFKPLIGKPLIRFFLAHRDADGNPTTGVTYTHTTITSIDHNSPDDPPDRRVQHTAEGGQDGWPSDRYLNIWVCKQGGLQPLLGYAQFPADLGSLPATDGVVIAHTAFGSTGTATAPYNLGRTATHEIGHWLDLKHIWGDDGTRCNGSDDCDDTPNQAGSNRGRPTYPSVSCGNAPNGDMFMNYMDYCFDDVTVIFTQGQVARMHATLLGARASLFGSTFRDFILQTGTALHETDGTFEFLMTDWNGDGIQDLVAIKKISTSTNSTGVHVLFRSSNFQAFSNQTGTGLHETDGTFQFMMADWTRDGRPDLVAIKQKATGTNRREVHIFSGASNWKTPILQTGTPLEESDESTKFLMADWNGDGYQDLVAVQHSGTSAQKTGVHILSGATNFQTTLL